MKEWFLVSVIIATYNWKEKRFTQTIESVLSQSYKNLELIIVNDASTNNIEDVILRYRKKYDNIIYLKNEKNSERSFSRNRWIFESRWKYIAFLDDDDVRNDKDKIKKQVEFLEKNKDYVLCGTSFIEVNDNNEEIYKFIQNSWDREIRNTLLQYNQFAFSSVMIRKKVLLFSGLFNSDYNTVEDYDLRLRIWRYWKIYNISNSFIYYRTWQGNTTTSSQFKQKILSIKLIRNNKKYYPKLFIAFIVRIWWFILPKSIKIKLLNLIKK